VDEAPVTAIATKSLLTGTFAPAGNWFMREIVKSGTQMKQRPKDENRPKRTLGRPVVVAMAIAGFGVLAMLIVDHGPWNRPQLQSAEVASYRTTEEAARAAGAMVMPTEPKAELEPDAPGPKPAQPANPR
jgi:hypothetical protein